MKVELTPSGVNFQLSDAIEDWMARLPIQAASALSDYLLEMETTPQGEKNLHVPAEVVAAWPSIVAEQFGLPPNTPLGFDVRLSGAMGKPGAQINFRWLQPGKTIPAKDVTCNGVWMEWQGKTYRLNSPIYPLMQKAEEFNASTDATIEEQFRQWAYMRELLGDTGTAQLTDGFLRSFRVVTANALTFSISTDEKGDVQVSPILLTSRREESGESICHVRALTEVDEEIFPHRLDQMREGVPAFPIGQGTYVVTDKPLQQALTAVRALRKSSPEQRKRAAMYPEAVIRELLGNEDAADSVFIGACQKFCV